MWMSKVCQKTLTLHINDARMSKVREKTLTLHIITAWMSKVSEKNADLAHPLRKVYRGLIKRGIYHRNAIFVC